VGKYYCVNSQLLAPNSQLPRNQLPTPKAILVPTPKLFLVPTPNSQGDSCPNFQLPTGIGIAAANVMGASDWIPRKPFDLRERLFEFACLIVRVVQFLHTRGPVAAALSYQLLKCGTSAGANYEEADDGSSSKDTRAKRKIALRELKETRFRLRVLRRCRLLTSAQDPVINESDELIRIVATLLRNDEHQK
jgi:four helix bundle protein